jgi:hypothetical protein
MSCGDPSQAAALLTVADGNMRAGGRPMPSFSKSPWTRGAAQRKFARGSVGESRGRSWGANLAFGTPEVPIGRRLCPLDCGAAQRIPIVARCADNGDEMTNDLHATAALATAAMQRQGRGRRWARVATSRSAFP